MAEYTITIQKDESGIYIWEVVGLKSCYTQAKTIPELLERIVEVSEWAIKLNKKSDLHKQFRFSLNMEYASA